MMYGDFPWNDAAKLILEFRLWSFLSAFLVVES
jgi:hypothetical protein